MRASSSGCAGQSNVSEPSLGGWPTRSTAKPARSVRRFARHWTRSWERRSVLGLRAPSAKPSMASKLYAWHAPEVDCISKGKARRPYEFGVKVGIASTFKGNLIVGARAFHRNPYDGH